MNMRFWYVIFFIFLFAVACDNVTFSPLVGKWQLKTVEKNGEMILVDTVWYNFQSISIFSLQIYAPRDDVFTAYEGMRTQDDKIISIKLNDERVVNLSDWNSTVRSFTIETVNRKKLLLRSDEGYLYSFIKF